MKEGTDAAPGGPRRRILFVTPALPVTGWGFGTRVSALARELSHRHDVELLTYAFPDDTDNLRLVSQAFTKVHTVAPPRPLGRVAKRAGQLRSLASVHSDYVRRLHSPAMQSSLDRLGGTGVYDIIQVESCHLAGFALPAGVPIVLDEHNIEFELVRRMSQGESNLARRVYNLLEYVKLRHEEERFWTSVDGCVLTSGREEPIVLARSPATATCVVPNGVDTVYFHPDASVPAPDTMAFTGHMGYRPNVEAAEHLITDILPLVRRRVPGAQFNAVGQQVPPSLAALAGPGVNVTGWVRDVRPYLAAATVVVVPVRIGGGTRLKVLEALAMGKAVVSTAVGCEGIEVTNGQHLLIADDPEEFAECVLSLMRDPVRARALGGEGRRLVERQYDWASVSQVLETFHGRMLQVI